jgi:ppGpp synthetase/RelA/SpoT-type nucleotidyltranferase
LRAEDIDALGQLEARYVPALEAVGAVLRAMLGDPPAFEGVGLTVASRPLKTLDTILEKLKRERTRLSTMQDIAGIRIVGENGLTRDQQDRLADAITRQFPSTARRIDRRTAPSFGYRALHLVVEVEAYPVEIQLRTDLQHGWADGMERFGDIWGRQIRYGGAPNAEDPEHLAKRVEVVESWKAWGELIDRFETSWVAVVRSRDAVEEAERAVSENDELATQAIEGLKAKRSEAVQEARGRFDEMRSELERIRALFEAT